MTTLTLEGLTKTFERAGTVVDSVDLEIEEGEFFTLLGPSGCGKSTILRMIAGFEEPTRGRILMAGRDITKEPPNLRGVGLVFQNYALFPHLSVARNVAFGLEVRKVPPTDASDRVTAALAQVRLEGLAAARIDQLSGGQQQRVALARALVIRPSLLLLDEPLSNLDAKLREETRATLRSLHDSTGVTTIYVTHDQAEAMGMSDRIAVLHAGKLQQVALPEQIYEKPGNRFVAEFIGRNNVLEASVVRLADGTATVRFANGAELSVGSDRWAAGLSLSAGASVGVCLRAETLRLADSGLFHGTFSDVEYGGSVFSCVVQSDAGPLQIEIPGGRARPNRGDRASIAIPENSAHLVAAAS